MVPLNCNRGTCSGIQWQILILMSILGSLMCTGWTLYQMNSMRYKKMMIISICLHFDDLSSWNPAIISNSRSLVCLYNIHDKFVRPEKQFVHSHQHMHKFINIYIVTYKNVCKCVYVILGKREGGFCFLEVKNVLGSFKKMCSTLN